MVSSLMTLALISPGAALNILITALGLGLVIFFHELGHFFVAKWCGVYVERFSIGFGPVILARKWGETEYALSLLPLRGYVKMRGQDDMDPGEMTDAEIAEPDFARLLEAFDNVDGLAAVGPLIVEQRDGGEVVFAGGRDISRWRQTRIPFHRDAVEAAGTRYRQPDYVMGTAMVSDRTAWEQAGLLDERYFFSGEVADWCERVRALGFQLAVDTTARALHHSNLAGSTAREGDYLYYSLRNRFLFAARHRSGQRFRFVMRWTAIGLGEAAKAMVRGKWVRAGACLSALRDGLAGRFGRRRPEQERRA